MILRNQEYRYGSAAFATEHQIAKAGMFKQHPNSVLVGFHGRKPIFYDGMSGLLLIAGARGGKGRDVLVYNICHGICQSSMVIFDPKGELYAVSQNQAPDGKETLCWNPHGLHGFPQNRINPVDYVRADSQSIVSDTKIFCENMIASSGSANSDYFEQRAREIAEALVLTLAEMHGTLTIPDLYNAINLIPIGNDEWLNLAYAMSKSRFPIARRVEEEIASSRDNPSNGFQGIMGELFKGFACYSDPTLMASVSPPFDVSLEVLCSSSKIFQFYMMPPAECAPIWAPAIRSLYTAAMIYKSRSPNAPQQTWIIDEAAQLGAFPLIVKLYTYGAGIGIRPWAVYQSHFQMQETAPNAQTIIPSSAALQSYFAVRDIETASMLSRKLGVQTLEYEDEHRQLQRKKAKQEAMRALVFGGDPFSAGLEMAHQNRAMETPEKQQRLLMTADEILNMPSDKQLIFTDGLNPIHADRRPYYEQRFMQGRFSPNPYHA